MKKLALFDFDGTLTRKDTLFEFVKFTHGTIYLVLGLIVLSPILILYKMRIIPNYTAKQYFLAFFYKGYSIGQLKERGEEFASCVVPALIRKSAMAKLEWHRNMGHDIIIISASPDIWIETWSKRMNISLIASRLEFIQNKFTGRLSGQNCYGIEKVNRLKLFTDLTQYDYIYAYGDSRGDLELLKIANEKYYKYFN